MKAIRLIGHLLDEMLRKENEEKEWKSYRHAVVTYLIAPAAGLLI